METPFEKRMKFLGIEECEDHFELQQRLKKTLHYNGKKKNMEYQSLAVTELAVEYLQELVPRELGRIDMYWASSLSRDVSITPCALMLALMYVKRLKHSDSQYLNQVSSSDLFLISVLVASKYLYDEGECIDVSNVQWAGLTNSDVEDINESERAFLDAINWKIFVKPDDFWGFLQNVEEKVVWKMSLNRNSFTYTDMSVIVSAGSIRQLLYEALVELCKIISICLAAYVGCVLTLCASNVVPAVVFSHALIPPASHIHSSTGVPNLPSVAKIFRPVRCVSVVGRAPKRSLHRLMNGDFNVDAVSNSDVPRVCQPWKSSWSPTVCFRASACLTVALIQELAAFSCGVFSDSMLCLRSLISDVDRNDQADLIDRLGIDLRSQQLLQNCNKCTRSSDNLQNFSHDSSPVASNSSTCIARPPPSHGNSREFGEKEGGGRWNMPHCADSFGSLCWNALFLDQISPLCNYNKTFPNVLPSSHFVPVFGY